ncbi:unnamed protein product [Rhizophagus irregularis]|uniref:RNA exonuclease 4 n=1 Tax=Rhizophagus irregularis TaxID=588596 RepID=A0A2I1H0B0_9GLOM|nr:hypothetical protein RhiirA4_408202 [Rhizophagus irregularis]CAB4439703.1 unnamed protein product [Rhizophagus irregularis]
MEKVEVELNSQELNLNLISLDKFEQLPQKKQNENETKNLKKKKKRHQGKKSSDNSDSIIESFAITETESTLAKAFATFKALTTSKASTTSKTTTTSKTPTTSNIPTAPTAPTAITEITVPTVSTVCTSPLPNNQHINAAIKKNHESAKLPLPFRPPKERVQPTTQPFYPYSYPHSHQMNTQRFQFYPQRYPQMNMKIIQPPSYYLPKRPTENVQPHLFINPKNRKQVEIEKPPLLFPRKSDSQKVTYMIPDMKIESKDYGSISFPSTELWFNYLNSDMTSLSRTHENNHCIAIDCEMVGVGEKGKHSVLARVSIVNYYGEVLLDRFVKSRREITDYRTQFSGITPELLTNASEFKQVQKEVENIMKDHIVVGQSIYFDFKVLKTRHPEHLIRDTSHYNTILGVKTVKGVTPSLKKLAKDVLGINIQEGEHDSIEDARASMILYRFRQAEWEEHLKTNGFPRPKECKFCDSSSHASKRCPYNKQKLKNDKDNLDRNIKNNDGIDYDEYNRNPNTSKYYSYSYPNNYNANYAPVTHQHYNIIS